LAWWFWLNTTNDAPRLSLKAQNNLRDIKNATVLLIAEGKIFFSNGKEIFQTLLSFIAIICAIQCIFESEHIARKPLPEKCVSFF
jgi:hypothetical protein